MQSTKIFPEISANICYMQHSGYQRFPRDFGGHLLPMIVTSLHFHRTQPCCAVTTEEKPCCAVTTEEKFIVYDCHALLINTCIWMQSACLGATHSHQAQAHSCTGLFLATLPSKFEDSSVKQTVFTTSSLKPTTLLIKHVWNS